MLKQAFSALGRSPGLTRALILHEIGIYAVNNLPARKKSAALSNP
ncbi:hypothetical protein EDWATA_01726 [Edwardsiella tarda ATCC 23685]|uniref:Uncharacterized protein n=1 Tax=Edwardsiella tarda ATCC 23685 TaxID=500638 RepID=D4F4Q3_EDWTA|nr:hypothetical protein EDWATA_01726 [Edwardsiella tarda ATCC 23685]